MNDQNFYNEHRTMMAHGNEIECSRYVPYGIQRLIEMTDHILYDPLPQITENRSFAYASFEHIFLTFIQTIEVQCSFYLFLKDANVELSIVSIWSPV